MRKAIEQETLAALVETGAAREFREGGSLAAGTAPRGQMAADPLTARTGALLALTHRRRAVLRSDGDQGIDDRAINIC